MQPKFRIRLYSYYMGLGTTMFLYGEGSYGVITPNDAGFFLWYTMLHAFGLEHADS